MYLLITVINNEELLDELVTGWVDMGITGGTVMESTGLLQLISTQIPIFAGFRSMTSGGAIHNKTIITAIKGKDMLDKALEYLEMIFSNTGKPHQGVYFVTPLTAFGRLGAEVDTRQQQRHVEKKIGKSSKKDKKE